MPIRKLFLNSSFLKIADKLSGQQVMEWHAFFDQAQWWPREKLLAYQTDKLLRLLSTAVEEVPFYRDLYAQHGIDVSLIKTINEMHKLPIVSKKDLKASYPNGCTRKTNWPVKEYFTSGSSGNPFAVMVDNQTMSQARALMLMRANYSGWQQGDAVFQTGMSLKRGVVKKIKDLVFNTYYASAFDLSDARLDYYLDIIKQKNIKYLMGYPGSMFALANRAREVDLKLNMSGVVTWGDNLYEHFRKCIEEQFQCRVTDTYGCGEGIQVAAQCPAGNNKYHIFMPHVIVEIVDDAGMPVPRGEMGNIVLTCLEPGAMPFIRYKVGDVGRMCKEESCSCGRGYDILEKIDGRDSDFIYTPNGNKLIVHFFTGLFEYYPEIDNFRVIQEDVTNLNVQLVANDMLSETLLNKIRNEILDKGDNNLKVHFQIVQKIDEIKTGKRKFVLSNINKDKNHEK
ncbi:MAG: AMP-binding protein [Desulfuromonadaceae bacterium]|nr:AMP-binding protein [Desulfuromonadaceae bacterium]MDD5104818.1 AMP-binding protein [Desulfuromonadaceae bacterium]